MLINMGMQHTLSTVKTLTVINLFKSWLVKIVKFCMIFKPLLSPTSTSLLSTLKSDKHEGTDDLIWPEVCFSSLKKASDLQRKLQFLADLKISGINNVGLPRPLCAQNSYIRRDDYTSPLVLSVSLSHSSRTLSSSLLWHSSFVESGIIYRFSCQTC